MTKAELRELAQHAAQSAPITKCALGETALQLTDRQWYRKLRDPGETIAQFDRALAREQSQC